jgi:hypothetical protein
MVAWVCLLAGIFSISIGILGVAYSGGDVPLGLDIIASVGAWGYWLILFGVLGGIAGGYYTFDRISRARSFNKFMATRSRAHFIRDLDEIERLAYGLGPGFELRVLERKREYKLK